MDWPEVKARLEEMTLPGDRGLPGYRDRSDIRAALQRVEELERRLARESKLLVECIKTRGELGERMIAAEAKLTDALARLADAKTQRAEADMERERAEAKLAKVVTLLTNVEWSDNPWNAIKAARAAAQTKEESRG